MQENEFEKQVKNMMEEFQLSPLDAAWEKVSRKLKDDKRRKRYFFFLLFFGLITAGFISYYISEKNAQKPDTNVVVKNDVQHKNDKPVFIDSNKTLNDKTLPETNKLTVIDTANINLKNDKKVIDGVSRSNKKTLASSVNNKSLPAYKNENSTLKNNSTELQTNQQLTINTSPVTTEINKDLYTDSATSKPLVANNNTTPEPNILNNNIDSNSAQKNSTTNTLPLNTTVKKKEKKASSNSYKLPNWQWGINASYGKSNLTQNLTSGSKSYPAALNYMDSIAGRVDSPSINKLYTASTAYSFGVVVQKKIFKNALVGIGLNYLHLSVKSQIGNQVNSGYLVQSANNTISYVINNYYRPGNASVYTNSYNFLELPVYFQQDIFHAKKVSFAYNAGGSVRYLLSSKSLIYNEANNIYYFKNGLLHKTQMQLQAGLNVKFNVGKSSSIYAGPQLSYSLTNNFKNQNDGTFHFINYGLQAGFLLNKK